MWQRRAAARVDVQQLLSEALSASQQNISKHLALLQLASGLIAFKKAHTAGLPA